MWKWCDSFLTFYAHNGSHQTHDHKYKGQAAHIFLHSHRMENILLRKFLNFS